MSVLPGRRVSRTDLIVGSVAVLVVLAVAWTSPGEVGILLAALAVGAGVFVLAVNNPLLALLFVVLASFVRTAQKEIVSAEALTPAFYAMLIALAVALARRVKQPPRLGVIEWLMAVYLVWNVISALLPHSLDAVDPITGESLDVYRWIFAGVVLPFVAYVAAKIVLDDERSVRWLLWTVVGMSGYSAFVAIMQFHGPERLVWPRFIVESPTWEGRAVGLFDQPVVNGMLLTIGVVVCFFVATRPGTKRWVQWSLYGVALASAYSVYLTHTRSALLSLMVAVALGAIFAQGWRRPFVVSIVAGVGAVAANASRFFSADRSAGGIGSSNEIYDRLNLMATSFRAIAENPFLGIGIARFRAYNTYEHVAWSPAVDWARGYGLISHQNELGIAAELGIPGVLMWLGVLLGVLGLTWRAVRELPQDTFLGSPLAVVGAIAMSILVVNALTVDLRILDFAGMLPFLLAGMVVGQLERHRALTGDERSGAPGAGLPGGMSRADQQEWAKEGRRPETGPRTPPGGAPVVPRPPLEPSR